MGETGPCGPCSEIHLDRGPAACDRQGVAGHECRVNGDCARYIELWNLVFIQYNRAEDRSLSELPAKHVDTGMGMERITAVLQKVLSNYDIDIMRELTATTERLTGKKYGADPTADISYRVIDDHARAVSCLDRRRRHAEQRRARLCAAPAVAPRRPPWPLDRFEGTFPP